MDTQSLKEGVFFPTLVPPSCAQAVPGTWAQLPAPWLGWGGELLLG